MKFRSLSTLFLIVAPAALAACGDVAPSDSLATDPTSESESNLAEAAQARRPPPPGPLPLVDVALREVELTASQRELLRGLAVSAQTSRDAAQVGSRSIERKLAAALRVASLDAAVVQAEIEALSSQHRTAQRDHAHALYVLHATLTPVQRETVVLAVRRHAPPRGDVEGGLQARGGPPPEGAMPAPEGAMPAPEGAMRDPFADLNLTEAQASALEAKLGARPDPNDRLGLVLGRLHGGAAARRVFRHVQERCRCDRRRSLLLRRGLSQQRHRALYGQSVWYTDQHAGEHHQQLGQPGFDRSSGQPASLQGLPLFGYLGQRGQDRCHGRPQDLLQQLCTKR